MPTTNNGPHFEGDALLLYVPKFQRRFRVLIKGLSGLNVRGEIANKPTFQAVRWWNPLTKGR